MPVAKDLTGYKWGMFTVIEFAGHSKHRRMYRCRCDCGNEKIYSASEVKDPNCAKSCGCIRQHTRKLDLVGKKIGRLTVLGFVGNGKAFVDKQGKMHRIGLWETECDCGKFIIHTTNELTAEKVRSCGCLLGEHTKTAGFKFLVSQWNTKHGMTDSREYKTWHSMHQRCYYKKHKSYEHYYGGRGIEVCERWFSFENFYVDMGNRPEGKTLDRIDNEKGYFKENCKWSTPKEQAQNRRPPQKRKS